MVEGIISLSIPNEKLIIFTKQLYVKTGFKRVPEPKNSQWDLASKKQFTEYNK